MELTMQQVAEHMRERGFTVEELDTAAEAREYMLAHIAKGAKVGVGGSVSVRDTDILSALGENGCPVYSSWGAKPEDGPQIRSNSRTADVYLTSANAITSDGRLVLVDGIGNRVGAIADGPKEVFFVVSHSKVVDGGINTALARIKKTACPQNARRLNLNTPCAQTGNCLSKECEDSMCRVTLVLERVPRGRSITVLFVEEALGY